MLMLHTNKKGAAQPVHVQGLIRAFVNCCLDSTMLQLLYLKFHDLLDKQAGFSFTGFVVLKLGQRLL